MKVGGLSHIDIIPFVTCNFWCPYCISNRFGQNTLELWDSRRDDMVRFLNTLDRKMVMVSGGEPMLWNGWGQMIKDTDHYWYFLTNGSVIPRFLSDSEMRTRVKLFIAAFHRACIDVGKFVGNMLRLQDMGYPVFCKILYEDNGVQFGEWEQISRAGIPVSFVPLVGRKYGESEIKGVMQYCQSAMYASRFYHCSGRKDAVCAAGTKESFELQGMSIHRCSSLDIPLVSNMTLPPLLKKVWRGRCRELIIRLSHGMLGRTLPLLGDIYEPRFYASPRVCHQKSCECEWHVFSDMSVSLENWKWQRLIDTGEWIPATLDDIREFVETSGGRFADEME